MICYETGVDDTDVLSELAVLPFGKAANDSWRAGVESLPLQSLSQNEMLNNSEVKKNCQGAWKWREKMKNIKKFQLGDQH